MDEQERSIFQVGDELWQKKGWSKRPRRLQPAVVQIKSTCEPFDTEMELEWERISNWIKHLGMNVQETHVSGHASGPQLKSAVETIHPKMIVPVHTNNAEIYEQWFKNTHLLKNPQELVEIGV